MNIAEIAASPQLAIAKLVWKPVVCILLIVCAYAYAHHAGAVSQKAIDVGTISSLTNDRALAVFQLNADVKVFEKLTQAAKDNQIAYAKAQAAVVAANARGDAREADNSTDYTTWVKRYQKKVHDNPKLALQLTSTACEVPDLDY